MRGEDGGDPEHVSRGGGVASSAGDGTGRAGRGGHGSGGMGLLALEPALVVSGPDGRAVGAGVLVEAVGPNGTGPLSAWRSAGGLRQQPPRCLDRVLRSLVAAAAILRQNETPKP